MNKFLLLSFFVLFSLLSLSLFVACGPNDHTLFRDTAKQSDFHASTIEHDGHTYLVFKEKFGDAFHTVGIEHDPNCTGCRK